MHQRVINVASIFSDAAVTSFQVGNAAMPGAEGTLNAAPLQFLIIAGLDRRELFGEIESAGVLKPPKEFGD
jgi:hypothetical protein